MNRTQQEIVERVWSVEHDDFLGFRREVLIAALDYEHARQFLRADLTAKEWNDRPDDDLEEAAKEYYDFALGKIRDHRGISASRSVDKLGEYAWLLGRDDVVAAMEDAAYEQYGAPKVKAFADGLGLEWPDSDEMKRMAAGERCQSECREGCA